MKVGLDLLDRRKPPDFWIYIKRDFTLQAANGEKRIPNCRVEHNFIYQLHTKFDILTNFITLGN